MKKEKVQKFNRVSNLKLTERDAFILLFTLETRFLSREQIERLFFANNGNLSDTTKAKANRRLTKLVNHGFLERLLKPVSVGKPESVYTIGKNGFNLLSKILEKNKNELVFTKRNKKVEFLFLEHSLGISDFRVSLEITLRNNPDIELLFWQRESDELNDRVNDPTGKAKYLPVRPDAFFGLQTVQGKSYFFLEVDMATEEQKRVFRKIIAYREYWKTGKYNQIYGFNSFRVLTVTTSQRRLENLLKTAEKAKVKNMFLFATKSDISDGKIFNPVWISTTDSNISIISS